MTRVSLREAYDNKDVVAQIYAIRDTAESAEDSAEQAVTTANTASDHVDALVPQVEGAVQNANSASASAQASAQTVAGYENRLATVEDVTEDLSGDLNAVTLRVTTAEGQIVTIQGQITSITNRLGTAEGQISALETADAQNVKINDVNRYAVGLAGNQDVYGIKTGHGHDRAVVSTYNLPSTMPRATGTGWVKMYETTDTNHISGLFAVLPRRSHTTPGYGIIACGGHENGNMICKWLSSTLISSAYLNSLMVTIEDSLITIWAKNISGTDTVSMREIAGAYNGSLSYETTGFTEATDRNIYTMTESEGVIIGYTDIDGVEHTFNFYQISS